MSRVDGRTFNELRPVTLERGFLRHAEGSVLITQGDTKVVCAASVEDRVPIWLRGKGQGWVTAEYSMLPRATTERVMREATRGKVGGRTHEIQRLIGRALRSVIDLRAFPDKTIWIDCDVIQADGGTRTASVTGAFIALVEALASLAPSFRWERLPLADWVAATSVGIVDGEPMLDLCYNEDVNAQVDMNVVMTETGRLIEVQGTAEGAPFTRDEMTAMMDLAEEGVHRLVDMGRDVLSDLAPLLPPSPAREGGSSA